MQNYLRIILGKKIFIHDAFSQMRPTQILQFYSRFFFNNEVKWIQK